MTTSGTTTFNLDLNNLIEEAFERCGAELRTGYDMRTARRSLNLLTIEWASRGINLWTIEQGQISLTQNQILYPLPNDTIDLLDQVIRQYNGNYATQSDININRISESTYSQIPNKLTTGLPIQVWVNRQTGQENSTSITLAGNISATDTTITLSSTSGIPTTGFIKIGSETISFPTVSGNQLLNCARGQNNTTAASHTSGDAISVQNLPCINVWPAPSQGSPSSPYYTFVYWRMRRIQDAGGSGLVGQDIPFRLMPCLVAGLAFYLAQKIPEGRDRIQFLKQEYEEQWLIASTEDREKAPARFVPRNTNYYR